MDIHMDKMNRRIGSSGFTLVELLAVMMIMAMMMIVAVGAFLHFGRGAGMRGSLMNVQSALGGARQRAITYRVRTAMTYGNIVLSNYYDGSWHVETNKGYFAITINTNGTEQVIGSTNYLADGIIFAGRIYTSIAFEIDGSCDWGVETRYISLAERDRPGPVTLSNDIAIYPLTGRVKVSGGAPSY